VVVPPAQAAGDPTGWPYGAPRRRGSSRRGLPALDARSGTVV